MPCVCPAPPEPPACADSCFWKVDGNIIANGFNVLGTVNNSDIRIHTNNSQRGVITADGKFGWKTSAPTTLFHIDCANPENVPSNVHFENLSGGTGTDLVIDDNGYVLKLHRIRVEQESIDSLKKEINDLQLILQSLQEDIRAIKENRVMGDNDFSLSQNSPNPFSHSTTINYSLPQNVVSASILIVDISGREQARYNLPRSRTGSVVVPAGNLANGIYQELNTKKLVVSR